MLLLIMKVKLCSRTNTKINDKIKEFQLVSYKWSNRTSKRVLDNEDVANNNHGYEHLEESATIYFS